MERDVLATRAADAAYEVHPLIRRRWSPRAFGRRAVEAGLLRRLLEAARWAPSSFNEQPWRFLVATRSDEEAYDRMLSCLVEPNQSWARSAPVLMLTAARTTFTRNDRPNRHAWHDVGLATAHLMVQATALGLQVHAMAGILPDRAREVYAVPDGYEVVTALAVGHPAETSEEEEVSRNPRTRRPLRETVFAGRWEEPAAFVV